MPNPHPQGCFWHDLAEKYGAPDIKYCEETICSFISEPANSWSNVAFMLVGLIVYLRSTKQQSILRSTDVYGLNLIGVGIFSFIYHLSNNFLTQYFDFLGMYSFFGLMLFAHLEFLEKIDKEKVFKNFLLSFIPFSIVFFLLRVMNLPVQISIGMVMLCCFISLIMIVKKSRADYRYFFGALFFFALAITAQILDIKRVACNPHNHWFQFHALWHVFNAFGMGSLFFYYTSLKKEASIS